MNNQMLEMLFGMAKAQFKSVKIKSLDIEAVERSGKVVKMNKEIVDIIVEGSSTLKGFVEVEK